MYFGMRLVPAIEILRGRREMREKIKRGIFFDTLVPLSFRHKLNYFSACRTFEKLFIICAKICLSLSLVPGPGNRDYVATSRVRKHPTPRSLWAASRPPPTSFLVEQMPP
jgi:hypothetical protein